MNIISLQTDDNLAVEKELNKRGITIVNEEVFKGKENGHIFKPTDRVMLHGMEQYPQFNGEMVTIASIREDGPYGKAYYFKADNEEVEHQLNWTYEYRLKKVKEID